MTIQAVIAAVQTKIGALSGIKNAPAYAPEQIGEFPFSVAYAGRGSFEFGAGGVMKGLISIIVEIHTQRLDLPRDLAEVMVYGDLVGNKLLSDPTLGGTCSTFEKIDFDFVPMGYGGADTIGFRFVIQNVKLLSVIT